MSTKYLVKSNNVPRHYKFSVILGESVDTLPERVPILEVDMMRLG